MDINSTAVSTGSGTDFTTATWNGAYLTDQGNGILFGEQDSKGVLFHTSDNGVTWNPITGLGVQNLNDVYFLNNNDVFIAGDHGSLLYSDDAGENWQTLSVGSVDYNLIKVYFESTTSGYVVTEGGILYYTNDGGESWGAEIELMSKSLGKSLTDIEFIDINTAYASIELCHVDGERLSTLSFLSFLSLPSPDASMSLLSLLSLRWAIHLPTALEIHRM